MIKDILRHLKKKRSKIALANIAIITLFYFFKDGNISLMWVLMYLITTALLFLLFSWGSDNPEAND
jgi:Ca2+/Na+ antiporter